jgi:hypothetical protein
MKLFCLSRNEAVRHPGAACRREHRGLSADAEIRLRPRASVQYRGYRSYLADLLERKDDLQGALAEYNTEIEGYPDEGWVLERVSELKRKMAVN